MFPSFLPSDLPHYSLCLRAGPPLFNGWFVTGLRQDIYLLPTQRGLQDLHSPTKGPQLRPSSHQVDSDSWTCTCKGGARHHHLPTAKLSPQVVSMIHSALFMWGASPPPLAWRLAVRQCCTCSPSLQRCPCRRDGLLTSCDDLPTQLAGRSRTSRRGPAAGPTDRVPTPLRGLAIHDPCQLPSSRAELQPQGDICQGQRTGGQPTWHRNNG